MSATETPACTAFSRRTFFRIAGAASALSTLPLFTEATAAHAARNKYAPSSQGIHIDANENPLGPCDSALKAMSEIAPHGGRYLYDHEAELTALFAKQQDLKPEYVRFFPGSSEPLHFSVLSFCSKDKPVVLADPSYEAPIAAAQVIGAPVIKVALADPKGKAEHDVPAMLKASANPGVIYICNPNNPTGTVTPFEQIKYAVDNLPKGAILLVDEAYIHLSNERSAIEFVKQDKDVIVLRTFSKLYGMAGLRLGVAIARPDLLKKFDDYGWNALPVTAVAAGKASLLEEGLVEKRRKIIATTREETLAWLHQNGWAVTPSVSNCFMIDVKRPGKEILAALAEKEIYIGRVWPAWPTHVRVSVGTADEMLAFRKAFAEVTSKTTAGLEPTQHPLERAGRAYTHLS